MAAFSIQIKSMHIFMCVCVCVCVCMYKVNFRSVSLNMYCSYNKRPLQGFHSWSFITYCKFSL